jgi:hypothetical protein
MNTARSNLLKLLVTLWLLIIYFTIYAQEKKIMSDERIKTQVIWREGKKTKYKFQELRFDRNGNRTEELRYKCQRQNNLSQSLGIYQ